MNEGGLRAHMSSDHCLLNTFQTFSPTQGLSPFVTYGHSQLPRCTGGAMLLVGPQNDSLSSDLSL